MKTVVNAEEIQRYGDTAIVDVLKRQPGVIVVNGRVSLHGLASYTQVLLNGERFPPGFSLESLSPDLVERIEIYPAATAEFGTQAMAGTINIVLKKTVEKEQRDFKLGLTHSDTASFRNGSANLGGHLDNLTWLLAAAVNRGTSTGHVDIQTLGRDASGQPDLLWLESSSSRNFFDGSNIAPRLSWKLAGGDTLSLQLFASRNQYRLQIDKTSTAELGSLSYPASLYDSRSQIDSARAALGYEAKIFGDARLESRFSLSENRREARNILQGQDGNGNDLLDRTITASSRLPGLRFSSKLSKPLEGGHALVFGIEDETSHRDETQLRSDITPASPLPTMLDQSFDSRITSLAAFGQDEWDITPRFGVYLGLRWEGIRTRVSGPALGAIDQRSSVWSPILQALWKLPDSKSDQLRLALTRTYRAPTVYELSPKRTFSLQNSALDPDYQGNPNLRPELTTGLDFGYEHYLDAGGLLGASTYVRRARGVIRYQVENVSGVWINSPGNRGNGLVRGITLEAKFNLAGISPELPKADVHANLTRNWSHVDSVPGPFNRFDSQPPLAANFGFDYKLPRPAWTLGGNFNFTDYDTVRTSVAETHFFSINRNLEAYALWRYDPRIQWRLTLSNLLARVGQSTTLYQDATSLEQTTRSYAPRAARLNLELKL